MCVSLKKIFYMRILVVVNGLAFFNDSKVEEENLDYAQPNPTVEQTDNNYNRSQRLNHQMKWATHDGYTPEGAIENYNRISANRLQFRNWTLLITFPICRRGRLFNQVCGLFRGKLSSTLKKFTPSAHSSAIIFSPPTNTCRANTK